MSVTMVQVSKPQARYLLGSCSSDYTSLQQVFTATVEDKVFLASTDGFRCHFVFVPELQPGLAVARTVLEGLCRLPGRVVALPLTPAEIEPPDVAEIIPQTRFMARFRCCGTAVIALTEGLGRVRVELTRDLEDFCPNRFVLGASPGRWGVLSTCLGEALCQHPDIVLPSGQDPGPWDGKLAYYNPAFIADAARGLDGDSVEIYFDPSGYGPCLIRSYKVDDEYYQSQQLAVVVPMRR